MGNILKNDVRIDMFLEYLRQYDMPEGYVWSEKGEKSILVEKYASEHKYSVLINSAEGLRLMEFLKHMFDLDETCLSSEKDLPYWNYKFDIEALICLESYINFKEMCSKMCLEDYRKKYTLKSVCVAFTYIGNVIPLDMLGRISVERYLDNLQSLTKMYPSDTIGPPVINRFFVERIFFPFSAMTNFNEEVFVKLKANNFILE